MASVGRRAVTNLLDKDNMKFQSPEQLKAENELRTMKRNATRVNKSEPLHYVSYKSDRATQKVRELLGSSVSQKPSDVVPPPTHNTLLDPGTYDGADLRPFEGRKGAMDFKKCPSRGMRV